jgi:hypothetical protein
MQRKPNPQLYKKMWGGNITASNPHHDDRDFSTTYDRSYLHPSASPAADQGQGSSLVGLKESFPL